MSPRLADDLAGSLLAAPGVTTYAYDALDRLTTITRSLGGVAGPRVTLAYDAADRLTGLSRTIAGAGTAVATTLAYDPLDRPTTLTHGVAGGAALASYTYAYDLAGRLARETNAEGAATYSYDRTGQLATVSRSSGTTTYTYDLTGNRTTASGTTIGAGDRLTATPGYTLAYDDEGNLTSKTDTATGRTTTYAYDHRDRLVGATVKDTGGAVVGRATYTYDALDRRIRTVADDNGDAPFGELTTWTVYDGDNPYADYHVFGLPIRRYLHGPAVDWLLARTDSAGATSWYLADRQGSVRDIASSAGAVIDHVAYDAFGRVTAETSPANGDRFKYTGREQDAVTGLQYNRARYYDAALGRWTQEDPIGFAAGDANLYRYVGNQPTGFTDPDGLQAARTAAAASRGWGQTFRDSASWAWGGVSWAASSAYQTVANSNAVYRVGGILQAAGGTAEAALGSSLFVAPEPFLTKVGAGALVFHGLDNMSAGWQAAYNGRPATTLTEMVLDSTLQTAGMDPALARRTACIINAGAGIIGPAKAGQVLLRGGVVGSRTAPLAGECAPSSPLTAGVEFEAEQLAQLGLSKNTTPWRPTVEQTESAAFKIIVGKAKATKGGALKGTTLDATAGGFVEIKWGNSVLDSSYQLRLQVYRSLVEGQPYTIRTTRPINPAFCDWLERWGVTVEDLR